MDSYKNYINKENKDLEELEKEYTLKNAEKKDIVFAIFEKGRELDKNVEEYNNKIDKKENNRVKKYQKHYLRMIGLILLDIIIIKALISNVYPLLEIPEIFNSILTITAIPTVSAISIPIVLKSKQKLKETLESTDDDIKIEEYQKTTSKIENEIKQLQKNKEDLNGKLNKIQEEINIIKDSIAYVNNLREQRKEELIIEHDNEKPLVLKK